MTARTFADLQGFLRYVESQGDLLRVRAEVDPELEITEIATRAVAAGGPALLFERVRGASFPLVINPLATARRIEWALGRHPQQIGEEIAHVLERINPPRLSALWALRDTLKKGLYLRPRRVATAPVQEFSAAPDLDRLPILKCWPADGGRFITLGLVHTRDPRTRRGNLGIYRMHVYGKDETGMHWQIQKGGGFHYGVAEQLGKPLDVAVVLGGDPVLLLAGVLPLPEGLEETAFAGFLRGAPTAMVAGRTMPLDYPANAEIVLEGQVAPHERRLEGPFGDHFGHYSHAAPFPVFRIRRMVHRANAVYPAAVVGRPPQEDKTMGDAVQEILLPLVRFLQPELRDLWAYYQAGFHNLAVAAVDVRYTKEAIKTALGLMGSGQMSLTKCIVLVDRDVDARDFRAVLRALRDHFEPVMDFVLISRAPLDTLDFTSFKMHLGSKLILDATRRRSDDPRDGEDGEIGSRADRAAGVEEVDGRILGWRMLEDCLLAVKVRAEAGADGREIAERLVRAPQCGPAKIVAVVSDDVNLDDDVNLVWGIFTRFDAARDIVFEHASLRGVKPIYRGRMGIDATWKPGYPDPLVMPDEIVRRVDDRWGEYGFRG
ncbi:MAG: UbiD family decarboxylase [Armatimonadetes bacterium]|nr:UbiD family decarboxylase [Armatimonadota bacterium]